MGAGLPAMQATRSARHTEVMPSQASQLPQLIQLIGDWFTPLGYATNSSTAATETPHSGAPLRGRS
ncbi:hypothetical protein PspR76_02455 [Pseudomonas sp. R76]|nr:hypothetical protein PspR76_02455 [Pseudomonas sp. R76]